MPHSPPPAGSTPNTRPSPGMTESEIQEAKRLEKMQAVCSSHHTAGTAELPRPDTQDSKKAACE